MSLRIKPKIYLLLSIACFIHIVRDVMQRMGIQNWFTEFGHVVDSPKYEVYGMVVFFLLGVLFFYLFLLNKSKTTPAKRDFE